MLNKFVLQGQFPTSEKIRFDYRQGEGEQRSMFSGAISVRRNWKAKDAEYYENDLINITAYGSQADFIGKYMNKGDQVIVEGEIRPNSYEKEGVTVNTYNFIVNSVYPAGGPRNTNTNNETTSNFDNFTETKSDDSIDLLSL